MVHKLSIERVDNGYIVKEVLDKDKNTTVVSLENKNTLSDIIKKYLEDE